LSNSPIYGLFVCVPRTVERENSPDQHGNTEDADVFPHPLPWGLDRCAIIPETGYRKAVAHINDLLYQARTALKDVLEANVTTQGGGKVYLSFLPHFFWNNAGQADQEKTILRIIDYLRDMNLDLAGGESAIPSLLDSEPVEIVAKAA
jgi:hypothetical protein